MKAEDIHYPDGASSPRDGIKTLQEAFDQLFTELDEIKADIEQGKIYANKQTEMLNDYAKQFILYKQAHNAAAQIMFAEDPELERRARESVEIFTRIRDAETEKENTK